MQEKDEETAPPDYVKGFNEGYTIAEHLPDLAEELVKAVGDTPRGIGFKHGHNQFIIEQERMRDKRPDWLRGKEEGPKGLFDPEKGKDIEPRGIEPER